MRYRAHRRTGDARRCRPPPGLRLLSPSTVAGTRRSATCTAVELAIPTRFKILVRCHMIPRYIYDYVQLRARGSRNIRTAAAPKRTDKPSASPKHTNEDRRCTHPLPRLRRRQRRTPAAARLPSKCRRNSSSSRSLRTRRCRSDVVPDRRLSACRKLLKKI